MDFNNKIQLSNKNIFDLQLKQNTKEFVNNEQQNLESSYVVADSGWQGVNAIGGNSSAENKDLWLNVEVSFSTIFPKEIFNSMELKNLNPIIQIKQNDAIIPVTVLEYSTYKQYLMEGWIDVWANDVKVFSGQYNDAFLTDNDNFAGTGLGSLYPFHCYNYFLLLPKKN